MKNFLGSGEDVVDRYRPHLHQDAVLILPEALQKISASGRNFIIEEVNFDRIVGESICVATRPGDQIVYAKRPNRWGLTRFVRNRTPEPSSSVVVILKKAEDNNYILITAFIGAMAPPEPWDRNATSESREFWNTHALVWGREEIIPGTESSECPW